MIRRESPLGSETPDCWLLIPQQEHARLSYELASWWGGGEFEPLLRESSELRGEFLAAVRRHDDGWADWWEDPGIDPEAGRPYSFTEMPPAAAQRLWKASIEACREVGPLAGWVVASHFVHLQSKRDADWHAWRAWIERVDAERAGWLSEWLAESETHSPELAERCLAWLQELDWISLWLCCRCPAREDVADTTPDPLVVEDAGTAWPKVSLLPAEQQGVVVVDPWPFAMPQLNLSSEVKQVPARKRYASSAELIAASTDTALSWRLEPA